MSTFDAKVAVATDFLRNRASLNRRTTLRELGTAMGEILNQRGQRSISRPVRREKLGEVLAAVDKKSYAEDGILLSALVVHFYDNDPGHRFFESAQALGLSNVDHNEQLEKALARYTEFVPVSFDPVVPDDISELGEDEDADIF